MSLLACGVERFHHTRFFFLQRNEFTGASALGGDGLRDGLDHLGALADRRFQPELQPRARALVDESRQILLYMAALARNTGITRIAETPFARSAVTVSSSDAPCSRYARPIEVAGSRRERLAAMRSNGRDHSGSREP
jgi:hypothetical protein